MMPWKRQNYGDMKDEWLTWCGGRRDEEEHGGSMEGFRAVKLF
jgi:hypothetical protein